MYQNCLSGLSGISIGIVNSISIGIGDLISIIIIGISIDIVITAGIGIGISISIADAWQKGSEMMGCESLEEESLEVQVRCRKRIRKQ